MDRHIKHNLTGQHDYDRGMTDKPSLIIGEVEDILQVSKRTVYNLIYNGTLRACRLTYHITIITKEDFFLMIRETTYCKRSVSIFVRQVKRQLSLALKPSNYSSPHCTENSDASLFISTLTAHSVSR